MAARAAPLTRRGPLAHVLTGELWQQRRAFLAVRPFGCCLCGHRVEAGETVVRLSTDPGYAGGCCVSHHVRGESTHCALCHRVRMTGPRCRRCGGSGYGEVDA